MRPQGDGKGDLAGKKKLLFSNGVQKELHISGGKGENKNKRRSQYGIERSGERRRFRYVCLFFGVRGGEK